MAITPALRLLGDDELDRERKRVLRRKEEGRKEIDNESKGTRREREREEQGERPTARKKRTLVAA